MKPLKKYEADIARSRDKRMKWWHEARYGMFVHWGLYSFLGRTSWVQANEGIPTEEYERLMDQFNPRERPAREWAKLAVAAGMKYMVLTTKHHEGFCLWDTELTSYNSMTACGRDLVREFVEACREFGLKIGFYYSLMDWHHPDGARCAHDRTAQQRFVAFTHGLVRELMTNYGKVDILWYDIPRPMVSHEGWEALAMNQMVRKLQPHIIINNRCHLQEDFSTPEGRVQEAEAGRGWEACMTFNDIAWGYMPSAAMDSRTPRDIIKMLNTACFGAGNLLLNIGPAPDGSVPEEAVEPLRTVGKWLKKNGRAVYGHLDRCHIERMATACGSFSRRGRTLYFWCRFWPGMDFGIGGFRTKLKKATFLASGKPVAFEQSATRILLKNLPKKSPDKMVGCTVIELDFERPPKHASEPTCPALWINER